MGIDSIVLATYPIIALLLAALVFIYGKWMVVTQHDYKLNMTWLLLLAMFLTSLTSMGDEIMRFSRIMFFLLYYDANNYIQALFVKSGYVNTILMAFIRVLYMFSLFFSCTAYYFCFYRKSLWWLLKTLTIGWFTILSIYAVIIYILW